MHRSFILKRAFLCNKRIRHSISESVLMDVGVSDQETPFYYPCWMVVFHRHFSLFCNKHLFGQHVFWEERTLSHSALKWGEEEAWFRWIKPCVKHTKKNDAFRNRLGQGQGRVICWGGWRQNRQVLKPDRDWLPCTTWINWTEFGAYPSLFLPSPSVYRNCVRYILPDYWSCL